MVKLKVYRTAIGFHDAYVAASSQKAALAAWGSQHDLFGRGVAEFVTDQDLSAEPLAHPGTVIRRLRGTTAEQIAALPADRPQKAPPVPARSDKNYLPPRKAKTVPKPDRTPLDAAEKALADLEAAQTKQEREFVERERRLADQRRAMEANQAAARKRLAQKRDEVRAKYDAAIKSWRG